MTDDRRGLHRPLLAALFVLLLATASRGESNPWPARTPVDVARGSRGVVACVSASAAEVGTLILSRGGNAVDASIAVGFALAVTWPEAGNIGGGGFMLVAAPHRDICCVDYRETAPSAVTPNSLEGFRDRHHAKQVGVPGTVAGFALAHQRFGRLPWSELVRPAVRLAQEGVDVDAHLARSLNQVLSERRVRSDARFAELRRVYGHPDGRPWKAGDVLTQPDLAATLGRIAESGAEAFYEGEVAGQLVDEIERGGGWITRDDLQSYRALVRSTVRFDVRGVTVHGAPPPSSGGYAVAMQLGIVDELARQGRFPTESTSDGWTAAQTHLMAEAMRRAFRERAAHLGDPAFAKPPAHLLDRDFLKRLAGGINADAATSSASLAGDIPLADPTPAESPQTTHFSVVDADGMAVSNTYTLEQSFGSRLVVRGAGFLLNNEMGDFNTDPGVTNRAGRIGTAPNTLAPGKRMLSSQSPTIVTKKGRPLLVLGSPGGRTIINTVSEVLIARLFLGKSLPDAVEMPRFHHQWFPDALYLEGGAGGWPDEVWLSLADRGHKLRSLPYPRQGSVHAIEIDQQTGIATGVGDWRRGGHARAVTDGK